MRHQSMNGQFFGLNTKSRRKICGQDNAWSNDGQRWTLIYTLIQRESDMVSCMVMGHWDQKIVRIAHMLPIYVFLIKRICVTDILVTHPMSAHLSGSRYIIASVGYGIHVRMMLKVFRQFRPVIIISLVFWLDILWLMAIARIILC